MFIWSDYTEEHADIVNSWLSHPRTNKCVGIDDWHCHYQDIVESVNFYYAAGVDGEKCHYRLHEDYFCKVVFLNRELVAVLALFVDPAADEIVSINPIIVAPSLQGRGMGTLIIGDFLQKAKSLLGNDNLLKCSALIDQNNYPGIRCFEKSNFTLVSANDDDDFRIYEYDLE